MTPCCASTWSTSAVARHARLVSAVWRSPGASRAKPILSGPGLRTAPRFMSNLTSDKPSQTPQSRWGCVTWTPKSRALPPAGWLLAPADHAQSRLPTLTVVFGSADVTSGIGGATAVAGPPSCCAHPTIVNFACGRLCGEPARAAPESPRFANSPEHIHGLAISRHRIHRCPELPASVMIPTRQPAHARDSVDSRSMGR